VHAVHDRLRAAARVASQNGTGQPPRHPLAAGGNHAVAVKVLLQHDGIGRGHRDRVEAAAAAPGGADLARQPSQRHARALLCLRARDAEGPRALTLVEQCEGRGGHEPERHERDEKLGEAHAGSVVADAARVNAQ